MEVSIKWIPSRQCSNILTSSMTISTLEESSDRRQRALGLVLHRRRERWLRGALVCSRILEVLRASALRSGVKETGQIHDEDKDKDVEDWEWLGCRLENSEEGQTRGLCMNGVEGNVAWMIAGRCRRGGKWRG